VETIQATLGQALLVLIALAVALFTLILLLVEADYILRLGQKLARRWKSCGSGPDGSDSSVADNGRTDRPRDEQAAR
jgi:hypothetical protein